MSLLTSCRSLLTADKLTMLLLIISFKKCIGNWAKAVPVRALALNMAFDRRVQICILISVQSQSHNVSNQFTRDTQPKSLAYLINFNTNSITIPTYNATSNDLLFESSFRSYSSQIILKCLSQVQLRFILALAYF